MVQTKMGLPVMVENDATACLMAELTFARMDGVRDAVLVAVAEGVGTCVLANGQFLSHNGMAGEFGHVVIDPDGPRCGCGKNGCWEVFSSCRAALRYYRELKPKGPIVSFHDACANQRRRRFAAAQASPCRPHGLAVDCESSSPASSPSTILIAGDLTAAWHRFGPVIERRARRRSPWPAAASDSAFP